MELCYFEAMIDDDQTVIENNRQKDFLSRRDPWRVGDVLLGEFRVDGILGHGGMGTVYLVRTRDGAAYAVKTLREDDLENVIMRRRFLRELRTWIALHPHPNLVACRFFRTIGPHIAVFAEYVSAGSLEDRIQKNRLTTPEQIIDFAIQSAWGIQAAHDQGVVHQDVKPANILLTPDSIAKVTDFGLARACRAGGIKPPHQKENTDDYMISSQGMTPAYASPEQFAHRHLTHATDIWSWGVSVLEMFTGGVRWRFGFTVPQLLEKIENGMAQPKIPLLPEVIGILKRCFREDPQERWHNLAEAAHALQEIYEKRTNKAYPRRFVQVPAPAPDTAYTLLRNRRIDPDEDDLPGEPMEWLMKALKDTGENPHAAANLAPPPAGGRKAQIVDDIALLSEARELYAGLLEEKPASALPLALICRDLAWAHQQAGDLDGAAERLSEAAVLLDFRLRSHPKKSIRRYLAEIYLAQTHIFYQKSDIKDGLDAAERAIGLFESEPPGERDTACRYLLARAFKARGSGHWYQRDIDRTLGDFNRAIELLEAVLEQNPRTDIRRELATFYTDKATALVTINRLDDALPIYDRAIETWQAVLRETNSIYDENMLADAYMHKGVAYSFNADDPALALYDRAIAIRERFIFQEGRTDFLPDLAMVYQNKADLLFTIERYPEAIDCYDKAIDIRSRLIYDEGRRELLGDLAWTRIHKSAVFMHMNKTDDARALLREALPVIRREIQRTGREDLRHAYEWAGSYLRDVLPWPGLPPIQSDAGP